jgi:hypothetical protein
VSYKHLIPYANATITQIAGGGTTDVYDQSPAPVAKWGGSADAWLGETAELVEGTGGQAGLTHDSLLVAQQDLGATVVELDDTVTYAHAGASTTRTVRNVAAFEAIGILRLTFHDV